MSGVIDTNLLLYAANGDCPEHASARAFLETVFNDPAVWYLTEGICYEFLRVATHRRVFPSPLSAANALGFLDALMSLPGMSMLRPGPDHWRALRDLVGSVHAPEGNLFFDIRTVVLMRENGVRRIYTADTDFLQFSGIEVMNPLRPV
ncbi:MAG: PIN domain-containing protein [Verrucomicrobiae bacterium]|nr:PIN domain-containing protein [Verrucomicrobiae bacterium]